MFFEVSAYDTVYSIYIEITWNCVVFFVAVTWLSYFYRIAQTSFFFSPWLLTLFLKVHTSIDERKQQQQQQENRKHQNKEMSPNSEPYSWYF